MCFTWHPSGWRKRDTEVGHGERTEVHGAEVDRRVPTLRRPNFLKQISYHKTLTDLDSERVRKTVQTSSDYDSKSDTKKSRRQHNQSQEVSYSWIVYLPIYLFTIYVYLLSISLSTIYIYLLSISIYRSLLTIYIYSSIIYLLSTYYLIYLFI